MPAISLNDLIQEKVSTLTTGVSIRHASLGIAPNFPDTPWTPGHHGRPPRMIAGGFGAFGIRHAVHQISFFGLSVLV